LVELIVVVAIIAILGTAAGLAVSGVVDNAKKNTVIGNASTIASQIAGFETADTTQSLKDYITGLQPVLSTYCVWSGDAKDAKTGTISTKSGTVKVYGNAEHTGWYCQVDIADGNASSQAKAQK